MDAAIENFTEIDFDEAVRACREAFTRHGYDILHASELTTTFTPADSAVDDRGHAPDRVFVLGVSNPRIAARAYAINKDVPLLIPKNIVIREVGGGCAIQAFNPILMTQAVSGGLQDIADELAAELREIMKELTR